MIQQKYRHWAMRRNRVNRDSTIKLLEFVTQLGIDKGKFNNPENLHSITFTIIFLIIYLYKTWLTSLTNLILDFSDILYSIKLCNCRRTDGIIFNKSLVFTWLYLPEILCSHIITSSLRLLMSCLLFLMLLFCMLLKTPAGTSKGI